MTYAGIGARKTPDNILKEMTKIAAFLEKYGYTLRSGAAPGADSAFELGVTSSDNCEIFLPWPKFASSSSKFSKPSQDARNVAALFHPAWMKLSDAVKKLMARNSHQVLGQSLQEHSDFVVCWTPDGKASGGTGQAIRIADGHSIPVFNLFNEADRVMLRELLKEIKEEFLAPTTFKKHIQMECTDDRCGGMCHACNLSWCSVCGGAEGSLTTHCPGVPQTNEQQEGVYCKGNDYTEDKGWHETNTTLSERWIHRNPVFE
jgi:hypothetical protein